ncbi:MAG: TOBE domain-containing protein [Verrucomicrobiota bacterium]|nr:TOBE domain-containing protein [Verrucomicrobiota bacterium]
MLAAERDESSGKLLLPFGGLNGTEPGGAAKCWAMIRPESLELVEKEEAEFSGFAEASTFLGNRLRLQLRVGEVTLIMDIANRTSVSSGTPVHIRLKHEEIFTWPRA